MSVLWTSGKEELGHATADMGLVKRAMF